MLLQFLTLSLVISCSAIVNPGPLVSPTEGEVWPKPQSQSSSNTFLLIRPHAFSFKASDNIGCPRFLGEALTRYWVLLATSSSPKKVKFRITKSQASLQSITIVLDGNCPGENVQPQLGDDESYTLTITPTGASLVGHTVWGILRGLETFSQLVVSTEGNLIVRTTTIRDWPRFPHRGLLLDTARHFIPFPLILQTLDAMVYNKFNVFHWHITDDESFPYKSRTFPELSEKGAYHPISKVYTQSQIAKIIEYARLRGIRVIPEFDSPSHTRSWGVSHPELLTTCGFPVKQMGPLDPSKESTFEFLTHLFTEVVEQFPDSYVHLGGDEIEVDCWLNNPEIISFMNKSNLADYRALEQYYVHRVFHILDDLGAKQIVWQEVFADGVDLPNSTIVHIWDTLVSSDILDQVTSSGKFALSSSCWYLDRLGTGGDWEKFYICQPFNSSRPEARKKLVLGGEVCMWSEFVNEYNLMTRVWPRASAAAERLWSSEDATNAFQMNNTELFFLRARLEEHACRMNRRGIQAQPPNGAGVCL